MCGARRGWRRVEACRGGCSPAAALLAHALLGTPVLAAGATGRRREAWACRECGFGHTCRM